MIYAKNICLSLGRNVILDDVSFSIEAGQYVGLIGPNGAGKTSLIKTILGLYKPTSGSVEMTPGNRIGYVPQSYSLSSVVPISVFEVLRMSGIKDKKLLEKNLLKVGLQAEFLQQNFHQLSGGQKQRVIIARSLCQEPNLIIFDEPLNGVDFETKIKIYDLLAQLNRSENVTILFVSHEVDHILCLNKTMHTGCHPLDFAKGNHTQCPILATAPKIVPIHHHHHDQSSACC
jgi:zinc transport system ATP-binding protein